MMPVPSTDFENYLDPPQSEVHCWCSSETSGPAQPLLAEPGQLPDWLERCEPSGNIRQS